MTARPRTFSIRSFGCQMNSYDAERMSESLSASGLVPDDGENADILVFNTCHIRERAAEKLYSEVGKVAARARDGRNVPVIAVAGCVAQAEGAEIGRRSPAVNVVVGPQAYHRLPELLEEQARTGAAGKQALIDLDMPATPKFDTLPARVRRAPSAFLTVQEGCDKFCAFCVVPYTRGSEASRPLSAILSEAETLVDGGAREITLLGQNVNAWSDPTEPDGDFGLLLRRVAAIPGVERLRYTTSHPRDVTDAMIRAHAEIPELMPYLHLPVQSGSDRVLKAMNRRHDRKFYFDLIRRFRAARPDLAITSDFIVGFPGETEADFVDTLSLVETVGYAQAFSFKYSPRPGTPAADRTDLVPDSVMTERLHRLQNLLQQQSLAFNQAATGRKTRILIERRGRRPGQWIGKSPWLQSVVVSGDKVEIGMIVDVELGAAGPNSMEGHLCETADLW